MKVKFTVLLRLLVLESILASTRPQNRKVKQGVPFPKILAEFKSTCGKVPALQRHEILKSQPTLVGFGEIPWQVGIFYGQDDSFLCSGTLISNLHVLTAAVCLVSIESRGDLIIRIGDWDISDQDSPYEAYREFRTTPKKVIFLEEDDGYEVNPSLRTVALLVLKEPMDFARYPHVTPICLPALVQTTSRRKASKEDVNDTCVVSGWGYQESQEATTEILLLDSEIIPMNDPEHYKLKLDSDEVQSNQSALTSERDGKMPRSLTSTNRQEVLGPILLSIPMLNSRRAQDAYAALEPTPEFNLGQQNPSAADLIADEYFNFNLADGIDPVVHEELELMSPGRHFPGPLPTESYDDGYSFDNNTETVEVKSTESPADFALHQSMFRHKEKYKKGKQSQGQPVKTTTRKSNEEKRKVAQDEVELEVVNKRYEPPQLNSKPPSFNIPNYMDNVVQERLSATKRFVLKQSPVTLQKSCQVIPGAETGEASLGKSCVTPSDPTAEPESLCMADLGSPVTCRTPLEKKRRTRSVSSKSSKSQDVESRDQEGHPRVTISSSNAQQQETRFALFGIVTWKRPCYEKDEFYLQKFTFVTDVEEFLPTLLKTLAKENT